MNSDWSGEKYKTHIVDIVTFEYCHVYMAGFLGVSLKLGLYLISHNKGFSWPVLYNQQGVHTYTEYQK